MKKTVSPDRRASAELPLAAARGGVASTPQPATPAQPVPSPGRTQTDDSVQALDANPYA